MMAKQESDMLSTNDFKDKNESLKRKKHSLIAISGMPGAGKTTVSMELLSEMPNLTYFDFGAFFRPIAYYLIKEKQVSLSQIKKIINQGEIQKLMNYLNLGFRKNESRECEISIRNHFYTDEELYNPEMNKITVDVGACLGDSLNAYIKKIIEEIRISNPVLLNARRPFSVCSDISNHIFLKADFQERARRKSKLEDITLEESIRRLLIRDKKEKSAGFWETFTFTEIIDTTDMKVEDTVSLVKKHILRYTIMKDETDLNKEEFYR